MLALDTTTASLALLTHHTKWGSRDTFRLYCHDLGWKGRGGGLLLEVPDVAIALQGGGRRNAGDKTERQSMGKWGSLRVSFSEGPQSGSLPVTRIKGVHFLNFLSGKKFDIWATDDGNIN